MALTAPQEAALLTLLNTTFPALQAENTALKARVVKLENLTGLTVEDHTPAAPPTLPETTFTYETKHYQFTAPTFYYNGETYVTEEVMDDAEGNEALLEALVENQTDGSTFYPGLLIQVDAPVS